MEISRNQTLFWKKKEIISFILSVLVLFIHISSITKYSQSGTGVSEINEKFSFFFQQSITHFAVPMFFMLSGITFFKDYDNKKYCNKIKSRVRTLVIPYLFWNGIWMIFNIFCSYSFVSRFFVSREPFVLNFVNVFHGIVFYKYNIPFWFIFNLIVFSVAAPLFYFIIRNKYVGICFIVLLSILTIFKVQIPESIFFSSTSIIYYLIGAIVGRHYFNFIAKRSNDKCRYGSLIFLVVYIALKNIFPPQINSYKSILEVIFFTLSAYALWNIIDIFIDKIRMKKLYMRSFAIYALHINIAAIITNMIYLLGSKSEWMVIPNFVITAILTVILINIICTLLEKF